MNKIRKAIIPCGGLGTRFLPVTKAIAKEILPIIDTPVLAYIVDELADSGIDSVLIVLGSGKTAIRDYFTPSARMEKALKNKPELYEQIKHIGERVEISFAMQDEPRGSGDAVMHAREFTGNDPFVMSNGDDLIVAETPVAAQLMRAYENDCGVIVGVQKVQESETDKYGIITPTHIDGRTVRCNGIVEKPKADPPSLYAALGRYVLTPEIYEYIQRTPEERGEVGLTEAICAMMRDGKAYAYEFDGRRYDMGDKYGAVTATVDFALKRKDMHDKLVKYLKEILKNEN